MVLPKPQTTGNLNCHPSHLLYPCHPGIVMRLILFNIQMCSSCRTYINVLTSEVMDYVHECIVSSSYFIYFILYFSFIYSFHSHIFHHHHHHHLSLIKHTYSSKANYFLTSLFSPSPVNIHLFKKKKRNKNLTEF